MKSCRGNTRSTVTVLNWHDEPCIQLNDEPIWGCQYQSYDCGTDSSTPVNVSVPLSQPENSLWVYEENEAGRRNKFRKIGTVEPVLKLEEREFEETFINEESGFEYVLKGRVEMAE